MKLSIFFIVLSLSILPTAALAHTLIGDASSFMHGFAHPFSGLDHVLAMVTIGLFAFQLGGRSLWRVPASFIAAMALGGALGLSGTEIFMSDTAIAFSVFALGLFVALSVKAPMVIAMALSSLFGLFHGYAHGVEMPVGGAGSVYTLGLVFATATLHCAGAATAMLSVLIVRSQALAALRSAGGVVALTGMGLLVGVL